MSGKSVYVNNVLTEQWDDDTRTYSDFTQTPTFTRPYTTEENADADARAQQAAEDANEQTLLDKARTALTNNANFLAIASPTNAQAVSQVQALTRQNNALIKLKVRDLLDTNGT